MSIYKTQEMGNLSTREFSIGNLYTDIDNQLSEMSGYEIYQMSVKENTDNLDINEYKPIALTEDWLLKFGFEKIDYHRYKIKPSKFDWYYTYSTHDNAFRFYIEDTIVCLNVIFYVHQLQNLYFALTGQELTLTL